MDIDIILEPDLTPAQVAELGRKAEQYGVRALWSSNYFAHWDCFLSLVPLAQQTSKLLMGPLAVSPFEMHPLKIANSLLSLNEMTGGRAVIAMGAGEGNIDAMGIQRPEKIVRATREGIEIVRGAARGVSAGGRASQPALKAKISRSTYPGAMTGCTHRTRLWCMAPLIAGR